MNKDKPLFFTQHQLKRMAKRGMSKAVIQSVVNNGEWREGKKPLSYEIEYNGIIVVLYEQKTQYNVSTCKLNRKYTLEAEDMRDALGIDFWIAVHRIVKELSKDFADI
jgi:hypothetical protein